MSGTGPSAGPPDSSILSLGEGEEGLGEAVAGVVDVVVVGAGEAVDVVGVSVVICCASTVGGDSHAARSAKPVASTTRIKAAICSRAGVRSATFSPL